MACRFPKLDGIQQLWEALQRRFNAAGVVPSDRWDADRYYSSDIASKGKAYIRRGGFVNQDVKTFDAAFFGISPREAENMDPQQRLMLEVVWEAFENCGLILPKYAGANVGVYVGGFMLDHMITQMAFSNRSQINQHSAAGMMMTMLSNRVSHTFDLRGPSLSIDTACSSSLVAFHYACQDVWRGACEMAIVGGCNVMMRPEYPMGMCKGHFLSRDGESKSFDERGDGYGRGEGAGAILLKPLDAAIADGDTILATVLASGTNQDGHTAGISMPNGDAQSQLIRNVCREFHIDLGSIDYVECHGTGTAIGDPTECRAIAETYGKARLAENPVVVGSIKSNIGHLEAAAGVAGVIKAVLTLLHRTAVPLGNYRDPHPEIPFAEWGIALSDQLLHLGRPDTPLRAAVNSFGYGGSNAHVILEAFDQHSASAPAANPKPSTNGVLGNGNTPSQEPREPTGFPFVLPVSARTEESLRHNASNLSAWLNSTDAELEDIVYTTTSRRAHLNHRAVAMGRNREELIKALQAIADPREHEQAVSDVKPFQGINRPVFVFTGMGPQWWAMGQQLYQHEPHYQATVDEADRVFRELAGFSILEEMLKDESESRIQQTVFAQPANFVLQLGIVELLKHAGVQPGLVVGHSVGELGSAHAAGVLSLEDALTVSYHRSQLQAETAGQGGMLAVGLGKQKALECIEAFAEVVSIAAVNSASTVTLAGDVEALHEIGERLQREGVFNKALDVEIPYHSPLMDPLKPRLRAALSGIQVAAPETPVYSTVTGERVDGPSFGADYWPDNIREPVEFEPAIRAILAEGYHTFVEIGPHPVLSSSLRDGIQLSGQEGRLIHTLRRNLPDEVNCVRRAAMSVHAAGCDIDWKPHVRSTRFVQLPNYAWQREPHWSENDRAAQDRMNPIVHPILGTQETLAAPVWRNDFDHQKLAYLRDHVVSGMPILPAAAYLEALLELTAQQFEGSDGQALRDVEIMRPAVITPDRGLDFTTTYDPLQHRAVQRSLENGKLGLGTVHLTAQLAPLQQIDSAAVDLAQRINGASDLDVQAFYQDLNQLGLNYGPQFRTVRQLLQSGPSEILARVEVDPALVDDLKMYRIHPTMLDGCFHALMAMLDSQDTTYLPSHVDELCFFGGQAGAPQQVWCLGTMVQRDQRSLTCHLTLYDERGSAIGTVRGLEARAASRSGQRLDKYGDPVKRQILNYHWDYGDAPAEPKRLGHWLAVGDAGKFSDWVTSRLEGFGASVVARAGFAERVPAEPGYHRIAFDSVPSAAQLVEQCGELAGVVFFCPLDANLTEDATGKQVLNALITFTQAMSAIPVAKRPRVYVITRGGFDIEEHPAAFEPASAAVNGWVRVACCELPGFRFTTIDIDELTEEVAETLSLELLCEMPEDEVALRGEYRFVSELRESNLLSDDVVKPTHLSDDHPVKVRPAKPDGTSVGTVRVMAVNREQPASDEVVIRVEKSLLPTALLQDQSSQQIDQPTVEIVGSVAEVGDEVTDLRVGDRVCGLGPAELTSHLRARRADLLLAPLSEGTDSAALVATIGLASAAKRATQMVNVEPGQRALVECSPIGLAIAEEMRRAGVNVTLATKDPESIDAVVREQHRFCLACPVSIQQLVEREGGFDLLVADVRSWQLSFGFGALRSGAGIVDTSESAAPLDHLPSSIASMSRTALSTLLSRRAAMEKAVGNASREIQEGTVLCRSPLEVSIADLAWKQLPIADAETSLVISYETHGRDLPMVQPDALEFKSDGCYLITGGFGGFGTKTALWLARHGARHLVLTGRSGANTPEKQALVAQLERQGVRVVAAACDTADFDQLSSLFDELAQSMPALKGVFHSAAVIRDQPIAETDLETFNSVMDAKALGAWNLHLLTQSLDLDHFVLYSSLSNQIGNSRQGAYCAANGFLNGLARLRKTLGLPGLSVNWGAISDVGVVADDEKLEQFLRNVGLRGLPSSEGLELLRVALARDVTQFGVVVIKSWADWARYETLGAESPRFASVIAADSAGEDSETRRQLLTELATLAPANQVDLMVQLIAEIVAAVLKSDAASIGTDRPINEMGIDSLMGTEIQVLFESKLGITVSVLELVGDATIRSLAVGTVESLRPEIVALAETQSTTNHAEEQTESLAG